MKHHIGVFVLKTPASAAASRSSSSVVDASLAAASCSVCASNKLLRAFFFRFAREREGPPPVDAVKRTRLREEADGVDITTTVLECTAL